MSMKPQNIGEVPKQTARIANAAFPQGNIYLKMREKVGVLFEDAQFASLFSRRGQRAEPPWRLALITIMQYIEGLSDRQAANAVRGRIDWKYILGLELANAGFDSSVLSEFRTRVVKGGVEQVILDTLLQWCRENKLLKAERERTDSTRILSAVRGLTRLESIIETMRYALNSIATIG
jgi:transposase